MTSPKRHGRGGTLRGLGSLGQRPPTRRRPYPPHVQETTWGSKQRLRNGLVFSFLVVLMVVIVGVTRRFVNATVETAVIADQTTKQRSADNHHLAQDVATRSDKEKATTDAFDTSDVHKQEQEPQTKIILYSKARPDRTGASMLDRLLCHAYAFHEGAVYGGACTTTTTPSNQTSTRNVMPYNDHHYQENQLTKHWGLSQVLPWACPPPVLQQNRRPLSDDFVHHILVPREAYFEHDTTIFTSDWQRSIGRQMIHHNSTSHRGNNGGHSNTSKKKGMQHVAVHVRRGDVTPCTTPERYLSNAYYLAVLDEYLKNQDNIDYNVTIYSETESYEPWQPFVDRGFHLALDYDLALTWEAFVTADVLVLSKSSFSLVPALLRTIVNGMNDDDTVANVIYTPFWHQPLSGWTIVPKNMAQRYKHNERDQCP